MSLIVINGPSVPNPVGTIRSITNAKTGSSQGMNWSYQLIGGWYQGTRQYTNTLRVITSSPFVGPIQIQQAILGIGALQGAYYKFPLPELNGDGVSPATPTEIDTGSFCQAVDLKQDAEDGKQWLATLSYGPTDINHEFGSSQAQNGSINPLETAPEVHWSGTIYEVSYPFDVNGTPYLNTAGDPLENPPKTEEARQVLSFVRNEATYNDSWAQQYRMALNSDPFLGFQPGQAKCKNISGQRVYTADYGYFWRVSYEFEFRVFIVTNSQEAQAHGAPETIAYGFQEIVLNAGLRQIKGGQLSQIIVNGSPVTNPVALNIDGSVLNLTWNPGSQNNTLPYYLVFNNYPLLPFSFLNIPQNTLTTNQ